MNIKWKLSKTQGCEFYSFWKSVLTPENPYKASNIVEVQKKYFYDLTFSHYVIDLHSKTIVNSGSIQTGVVF